MPQTRIMPDDPNKAVKHVIDIVERLLDIMAQESMAMARQDTVSFTAAQHEKETLSKSYQQCSEEFRERIMEFREADKSLLDRLDAKQRELAARSKENMAVMERMSG